MRCRERSQPVGPSAGLRFLAAGGGGGSGGRRFCFRPARCARGGDGQGERTLDSPNRLLMSRVALGATRELNIKGWGGEPVQAWVTYPPNFDPAKKWPLLNKIP